MRYSKRIREPSVKQSMYLRGDLRDQVREEAKRLNRSVSWIINRCVQLELKNIQALESQVEQP